MVPFIRNITVLQSLSPVESGGDGGFSRQSQYCTNGDNTNGWRVSHWCVPLAYILTFYLDKRKNRAHDRIFHTRSKSKNRELAAPFAQFSPVVLSICDNDNIY